MKRLLVLLPLLPLLASCVENNYYDEGYYRRPPSAHVEVPYGYSYQDTPNTHYHTSERPTVYRTAPVAYRHYSQHGHRHVTPHNKNRRYRNDASTHGHDNNVGNTTHGHADNRAEIKVPSNNNKNTSIHGHNNLQNNAHGHD
ncbi:hypothetical protein [Legionella cardiaca]|uniref:Lipoprotein n=1 Tax=Legionella cardiaca TaxID=1071983 RepID=A0ABY8AT02_9GAMM|nr:hypothetical protein [Legionella cardiaca]WED43673.1 hypothetical protein PXX05_02535 [Legionella cardiaca]